MSNLTHTQDAAVAPAKWQLEEACKLATDIGRKNSVGLGDSSNASRAVMVQAAADLIAYAWHGMVLTQTTLIGAPEEESIPTRSAPK